MTLPTNGGGFSLTNRAVGSTLEEFRDKCMFFSAVEGLNRNSRGQNYTVISENPDIILLSLNWIKADLNSRAVRYLYFSS